MQGPMRRLRFGAILAVTTLATVLVADVVRADVPPPTFGQVAMAGQIGAQSFQVIGQGGSLGGSAVFGTGLVCSPCSVKVFVRTSDLIVAGQGALGLLPGERIYTIANYVGTIGVTRLLDGTYSVTFVGGAEAIRETPPDGF